MSKELIKHLTKQMYFSIFVAKNDLKNEDDLGFMTRKLVGSCYGCVEYRNNGEAVTVLTPSLKEFEIARKIVAKFLK